MKNNITTEMTPVLILSAHTIALGIIEALGPKGVPLYLVSYSEKDMAHKSKYVKETFILSHPEKYTGEFIQGLLDIAKQIGKAILLAADDPTLTTLAMNHAALTSSFIIPTPDWSIVQKFINKDLTYSLAERERIPYPKTLELNISEPLKMNRLHSIKFPCLVKPVQSHTYYEAFNVKMTVVNNREELEVEFNQCRNKQIDITLQEIIPGDATQGYNFNSLFYDGQVQQGFTAYKIRMTDHGYGIPTVVKSCAIIDTLRENSEKILTAIGYEGYSCVEYKFDQRDGQYKLLEVNGRYNRSSLLSVKVGINFPWTEYKRLTQGTKIDPQSYQPGVYYIDEFKDLQVHARTLLRGDLNLFRFLRPYFSKHVFAVFSSKDPAPFMEHTRAGMEYLFQRGDDRNKQRSIHD